MLARRRGVAEAPNLSVKHQHHTVAVCSASSSITSDDCSDPGPSGSCPSEGEVPSLLGPRAPVLRRLCASDAGARLPAAVKDAAAALEAACAAPSIEDGHRRLSAALQELHGMIVTVDHGLSEQGPSPTRGGGAGGALAAEEGRQWLRDAQAYVLHIQAQAATLAGADGGSGVADAWAFFLLDAARCLGRVSRQMAADGGEGEGVTYGSAPALRQGPCARRLVPTARLPYATYWAKATAI